VWADIILGKVGLEVKKRAVYLVGASRGASYASHNNASLFGTLIHLASQEGRYGGLTFNPTLDRMVYA
jgi:hypothetical protein